MRLADQSRTTKDLRSADAREFAIAAASSLDAAAAVTAGWTRRRLLDVALTLAVLNAEPEPVHLTPRPALPHTLPEVGPRYTIDEAAWTNAALRQAHNAWTKGQRGEWATQGERMYQRLSKRRRTKRAS